MIITVIANYYYTTFYSNAHSTYLEQYIRKLGVHNAVLSYTVHFPLCPNDNEQVYNVIEINNASNKIQINK